MKLRNQNCYLWVTMSVLYSLGLIIIANSFLNNLVLIPIIFRKFNIPVAAWILIGFYTAVIYYFKKIKKDASPFLFQTIVFGWATHQYLLYIQLFKIVFNSPLGKIYIGYIILLFSFVTFLLSLWALHIIKGIKNGLSNPFLRIYFLPVILLLIWPIVYFLYNRFYVNAILTVLAIGAACIIFRKDFTTQLLGILRRIHSDRRKVAFILFIVSFIFRFSFSVNVILKTEFATPKADFTTASDDGPTYDMQGKLLAKDFGVLFKNSIITPGSFEPGYGIFLSLIYRIFGHNYFVVGFFQAILGSILTLLCFDIAQRFFNYKTALISSYLIALNQLSIFIFGTLHVEAVYIFLVYLSLWILIVASEDILKYPGVAFFISGLTFGLGIITRGVIALFPIFILIWMLGKSLTKNEKYFKAIKAFGIFSSGILIIIIALCYINYLNIGKFILTNKGNAYLHVSNAAGHFDEKISPGNILFTKRGFDFSRPVELLKQVASHPASFIKTYFEVVPVRMRNFFFWHPHGNFDPVMLYLDSNPFMETLLFYSVLMAFAGVILTLSRLSIDRIFLLCFVCYYSLIHSSIGYVQTVRYRTPAVPVIIMFVSYGIAWILSKTERA